MIERTSRGIKRQGMNVYDSVRLSCIFEFNLVLSSTSPDRYGTAEVTSHEGEILDILR